MEEARNPRVFWGLGLSDIEQKKIVSGAMSDYRLRNWPLNKLPKTRDVQEDRPFMIWVPWRVWDGVSEKVQRTVRKWETPHKILILDKGHDALEFDETLDQGFMSVVRSPLTGQKIQEVLFRAKEVHTLYEDIVRMAKEISLEREIITHKTNNLIFLNQIMARAVESLNPTTILNQAREDLNMLLPVAAAQGVFWQRTEEESIETEIFLAFHEDTGVQEKWIELLLESAAKLSGRTVGSYQLTFLMDSKSAENTESLEPSSDTVVLLPLKAGGENFGCLALFTPEPVKMTREQRQVLHSAANHLGLALKNALLYREVKIKADYDGLTRIHSRQYFDERLAEELKRHQRYGYDLSLLLLDLDHFKAVNDTYGHQVGDMVLREVGKILQDTLRSTDFASRYGGEEFTVILPHTDEDKAWQLAERLRERVAKERFTAGRKIFRVTTSVGVASMSPGPLPQKTDLLRRADHALYLAKAKGRNQVCVSPLVREEKAQGS
ncbi:MAG: diguanylate cyclase [Thermodesulfobacteriota bacterium]|nr:diguanylate cyclase [Thermodesulfobacteriota bacterium]